MAKQIEEENRMSYKIVNATNYRTVQSVVKAFLHKEEIELEIKKAGKDANIPKITQLVIRSPKKKCDLFFDQINNTWLKSFETSHLSKDGNTVGGLNVYMRAIRAIFNRAIADNYVKIELYPFGKRKYNIPSQPTKKRAISKADISTINNTEFPENSPLWHAKNYFLFSFFCRGMNFIDMAYLTPKDILDGNIVYIRKKTMRKNAKTFTIQITPQIQNILNIYTAGKRQNEFIFPIIDRKEDPEKSRFDISNRRKTYNKYLKKVAEAAGISKTDMTSYVSRHSWGTVAKRSGISIGTISDGYGHGDQKTTQVYLDSFSNDEINAANEIITSL